MIRILHCVNIMDRAGLETILMNYYRHIDRDNIQFDFLTHRPNKGSYDDEIVSMGGRVYYAPRLYPNNYVSYFKWMKAFFKEHPEYNIVHSHIDAMSFFPLLAAKLSHIPVRIAHSHSSKLDIDFKLPIKYLCLKLIPYVANIYCACGDKAGKFMFKNRSFKIINNAINLDKYRFNINTRDNLRNELGLNNKLVIGQVGRYCYIKNQLFTLDVFAKVKKENDNAYLLLIGKGEDETKIRNKIHKLHLDNDVELLIDRDDVDKLYNIMDVLVMPSLFEGLPVVAIEALANGLTCIVSSNISKEILLSNNIQMLDLNVDKWKDSIISTNKSRHHNQLEAYDITTQAKLLSEYYMQLLKEHI